MSERSFTKFKLISVSLFVLGLVSATLAFSLQQSNGPGLRQRRGFILRTEDTTIPTIPHEPISQSEIASAKTIRYQKSDGTFKQVKTYYNAVGAVVKKEILFGIPGQGVFKINNPSGPLIFLSSMPSKDTTKYVRIDDGHNHPNFLRDDWVKGLHTYVLRFPDQEGGYVEMYCAPDLDGEPIRKVIVSSGGVSITEMSQITLGNPDERAFGPLPKMLVDYEFFKRKIATMEEVGRHDAAEAMQRELDEQIAKQMKE